MMINNMTTPVLIGQLRHAWTALAAFLLSTTIAGKLPPVLVTLLGELGTEVLFTAISSVVALVTIVKGANAIEKTVAPRLTTFAGFKVTTGIASVFRHILTFVGIMLATLGVTLPNWLGLALSGDGLDMLMHIIGLVMTYIQFLGSATDPTKRINEHEYTALRKKIDY